MMQSNRLRYWIMGGYLIPILLSAIVAGIVSANVNKVRQTTQEVQRVSNAMQMINHLVLASKDMTIAARGYILQRNSESYQLYQDAQSRYQKAFTELQALIINPEIKQNLENLNETVYELEQYYSVLFKFIDDNKVSQALELWKQGKGTELSLSIFEQSQKIISLKNQRNRQENQGLNQSLDHLNYTVWIATGVALLGLFLLGVPLTNMILKRIHQEAVQILEASQELVTIIEDQERVTVQQATSVNETTASMDELGASSRQSAEQAATASAGANQVLWLAGGGVQKLALETDINLSLKIKMEQVQQQIMRLSEHLGQIYNITNVVTDLANQTNMLALNASVEAVRAGENGKGFGVVATEIRKLADQSRKSSEKISSIVSDIQTAATITVRVTEEGAKSVQDIVRAINDVAVNLQQISLNTKQQSIAVEQVVEAMNNLNCVARDMKNSINQTKQGIQKLNETAKNLQTLV